MKLYLEKDGNEVVLKARDDKDSIWRLISLRNGEFVRYDGINDDIGIKVDEEGRIVVGNR